MMTPEKNIDLLIETMLRYHGDPETAQGVCVKQGAPLEWFRGELIGYLWDCMSNKRYDKKEVIGKIIGFTEGIAPKDEWDHSDLVELNNFISKSFWHILTGEI
jgi:hypothetical protein